MIRSNRRALKHLSAAIIITISTIFLFNYHIWSLWKWSAISVLKIPSFPADNSLSSMPQTPISKPESIFPPQSSSPSLSSQPPPQPPPQQPKPETKLTNLTPTATATPTTPTQTNHIIPPKIWYKLGPKGLSPDSKTWTQTCITTNPNYTATFLDDTTAATYINSTFSTTRPDIVHLYNSLQIPILKADLLRYILLYNEGGIWSDLDVSCSSVPIDNWIPERYKGRVGLVVGLEFDAGWGDVEEFLHQFVSWMILAERGSVHLWRVVEDILERVERVCKSEGVGVEGLTLQMVGDVVDFTGPRAFTEGVVKSLNDQFISQLHNGTGNAAVNREGDQKGGKGKLEEGMIDYRNFSGFLEPKLIGDVLVLPGWAFADSVNDYGDEVEVGEVLVTHHYAGSWKNANGGELA